MSGGTQQLGAVLNGSPFSVTDASATSLPDVDVNTDSGSVLLRVRGAHIELTPPEAQALILSLIEATNQTQRSAVNGRPAAGSRAAGSHGRAHRIQPRRDGLSVVQHDRTPLKAGDQYRLTVK